MKHVSPRNHENCRINPKNGSLAEREYWAFRLAKRLALDVPDLTLWDKNTTVQVWLDLPDAQTYATTFARLRLHARDVFECALFDWLTGQQDRHNANYLFDPVHEKIILVDSAFSFLKHDGAIPDYLEKFEIMAPHELEESRVTSPVHKALRHLDEATLKKTVPLKDPTEINALTRRLSQCRMAVSIHDLLDLYRGRFS